MLSAFFTGVLRGVLDSSCDDFLLSVQFHQKTSFIKSSTLILKISSSEAFTVFFGSCALKTFCDWKSLLKRSIIRVVFVESWDVVCHDNQMNLLLIWKGQLVPGMFCCHICVLALTHYFENGVCKLSYFSVHLATRTSPSGTEQDGGRVPIYTYR